MANYLDFFKKEGFIKTYLNPASSILLEIDTYKSASKSNWWEKGFRIKPQFFTEDSVKILSGDSTQVENTPGFKSWTEWSTYEPSAGSGYNLQRQVGSASGIDSMGNRSNIKVYRYPIIDSNYVAPTVLKEVIVNNLLKPIINNKTLSAKVLPISKKLTIIKKDLPKESLPYLSHVENGKPFFKLPDGISTYDFEEALKSLRINPELESEVYYNDYKVNKKTIPQSTSLNTSLSNKTDPVQNNVTQNNNVLNKTFSQNGTIKTKLSSTLLFDPNTYVEMYAYPRGNVNLYSIHPDVFVKVLDLVKNINKSNNKKSKNISDKTYFITPFPLKKKEPGTLLNDTLYHFIDKDLSKRYIYKAAVINPNIVSDGDYISLRDTYLYKNPENNKVNVFITNDDTSLKPSFVYDNKGSLVMGAGSGFKLIIPHELGSLSSFFGSDARYKSQLSDPNSSQVDKINAKITLNEKGSESISNNNILKSLSKDRFKTYEKPSGFKEAVKSTGDVLLTPFKEMRKSIKSLF